MAETSPNVYTFVTRYSAGDADSHQRRHSHRRRPGPLLRLHRGHDRPAHAQRTSATASEAVIGYWPTAAIGLVRNAGEQWLSQPGFPSQARPGSHGTPDHRLAVRRHRPRTCARQRLSPDTTDVNTDLSEPTKDIDMTEVVDRPAGAARNTQPQHRPRNPAPRRRQPSDAAGTPARRRRRRPGRAAPGQVGRHPPAVPRARRPPRTAQDRGPDPHRAPQAHLRPAEVPGGQRRRAPRLPRGPGRRGRPRRQHRRLRGTGHRRPVPADQGRRPVGPVRLGRDAPRHRRSTTTSGCRAS